MRPGKAPGVVPLRGTGAEGLDVDPARVCIAEPPGSGMMDQQEARTDATSWRRTIEREGVFARSGKLPGAL